MYDKEIQQAADLLRNAKHAIAFTGAGISVESGVPPFRGSENSVWNNYDPQTLEISYFYDHPDKSWPAIKEIFYNFLDKDDIKPNDAHILLAKLEQQGIIKSVITQNIDCLHQLAGTKNIYEFHGTAGRVICTHCNFSTPSKDLDMSIMPPRCPKCNHLLKPDFIFFGEGIPRKAYEGSFSEADAADVVLVIGTTGEVMPAAMVPHEAKRHGAKIIEVNPNRTTVTNSLTDVYIGLKAGDFARAIQPLLIN